MENRSEDFKLMNDQTKQISEFLSESFGGTEDEKESEEEENQIQPENENEEDQEDENSEIQEGGGVKAEAGAEEEEIIFEEEDTDEEFEDDEEDLGEDEIEEEDEQESSHKPSAEFLALQEQNRLLIEKIESFAINSTKDPNTAEINNTDEKASISDDFIQDLDIDDITSDKDLFNKVLLRVVKNVSSRMEQKYKKNISTDIKQFTDNHTEMKNLVDSFYKENADLTMVKSTVQAAAVDVIKNNPNMKIKDVFKTAAKNTRQMLGMKKEVKKVASKKTTKKTPALAKKTQSAKKNVKKENRTALQKGIDDLL